MRFAEFDYTTDPPRLQEIPVNICLIRLDVSGRYARTSWKSARSIAGNLVGLVFERYLLSAPSQRRQVTIVRSIRDHEFHTCLANDLCAFQISQLGYKKRTSASPEPLRYLVELEGGSRDPVEHSILSSEHRNCFTTIKLSDQAWAATPWRAPVFSSIVLGFDFDFSPMCVLSLTDAGYMGWRAYWQIRDTTTPWRRYPNSSAVSSTFEFPYHWDNSLGYESMPCAGGLLAVRMCLDVRDNNWDFEASFRCQSSHGITAIVWLRMNRPNSEQPRQFSCTMIEDEDAGAVIDGIPREELAYFKKTKQQPKL